MLINIPGGSLFHITHNREEHPRASDFSMHAHGHFELLYFISGNVSYLVEGNTYSPSPGDILLFNVAETHKVILNSDTPYERTVLQVKAEFFDGIGIPESFLLPFTGRSLGEQNIFHPDSFKDELWRQCLHRITEVSSDDKFEILPYLLPLLNEIKSIYLGEHTPKQTDQLDSKIVRYINAHITEDIHPESIAKSFFISRTALYTSFRKATGSSIHDYINIKRLIMAQSLLQHGEKSTKVYTKCGFKDYTTFFRAYKAHFGISPGSVRKGLF